MNTYVNLNSELNLYSADGKLQLNKDKEAARAYFLEYVNTKTQFFHDLEEKVEYLTANDYWDKASLDQYDFAFIKKAFQFAYSFKFRFQSFMGAYKFYTTYALRSNDGQTILERYEDRVVVCSLNLAQGNKKLAMSLIEEIISGRYQPATPTFQNAGKAKGGEQVSCFLLNLTDSLDSIQETWNYSAQLSKIGGGVAINLSNIRETGAPLRGKKGLAKGVINWMKIYEDIFSTVDQLGTRPGAGAAYLNIHHPDIMKFLDCKRENADEKLRIKTLSTGVVITDVAFELARKGEDIYLFSPYDIQKEYGVLFSDLNITEKYQELVDNPRISKKKLNARKLLQTIAELQFESGYPYLLFADTANHANPVKGNINMSNLCVSGDTKILTDHGYRRVVDLYNSQEDLTVVSDNRVLNSNVKDYGISLKPSTKMFKTAENASVFKVETKEGFELKATDWHKFFVEEDGKIVKKPLIELEVGDKILVQPAEGTFGNVHNPELAYQTGKEFNDSVITETFPEFVWSFDKESQVAFLNGIFGTKDFLTVNSDTLNVLFNNFRTRNLSFGKDLQVLLLNLGMYFEQEKNETYLATVSDVFFYSVEDVYDVTVEDGHSVIFDGLSTSQCSEILQINEPTVYNEKTGKPSKIGKDISCNLGSMNVFKAMSSPNFEKTIDTAMRALTAVSDMTSIDRVPTVKKANQTMHSVGLGQMSLATFFATHEMYYGDEESLDFTNIYFMTVNYYSLVSSHKIGLEHKTVFEGFEDSKYADGTYFDQYVNSEEIKPATKKVQKIFDKAGIHIPTQEDWKVLKHKIMKDGLYHSYRLAVPPTGNISYINNSSASIHPITTLIEIRKEGALGRVYYPTPELNESNMKYFKDAYELGYEPLIDVYAEATKHTDQGLSCTLFFKENATTRDVNKAQIYAWKKGIKTLYYIRLRAVNSELLDGLNVQECVSCAL